MHPVGDILEYLEAERGMWATCDFVNPVTCTMEAYLAGTNRRAGIRIVIPYIRRGAPAETLWRVELGFLVCPRLGGVILDRGDHMDSQALRTVSTRLDRLHMRDANPGGIPHFRHHAEPVDAA